MSNALPPDFERKLRLVFAAIDAGVVPPDPIDLLWAKECLLKLGEVKLARECERRARFVLPHFKRDLT